MLNGTGDGRFDFSEKHLHMSNRHAYLISAGYLIVNEDEKQNQREMNIEHICFDCK